MRKYSRKEFWNFFRKVVILEQTRLKKHFLSGAWDLVYLGLDSETVRTSSFSDGSCWSVSLLLLVGLVKFCLVLVLSPPKLKILLSCLLRTLCHRSTELLRHSKFNG